MTRFPSPDAGARIDRRAVHVLFDGRVGARCAALLDEAGIGVTTAAAADLSAPALHPDVVTVLATDRPRPDLAQRLDTAAWQTCAAWTSGTMIAHEFRVGPSILPGRTPCFECWSRRVRSLVPDLAAHDAVEAFASTDGGAAWFRGQLAPLVDQVAALLAAESLALAARLAGGNAVRARTGFVWEGDGVAGALRVRRFAAVAACSRCADRRPPGSPCALADHFTRYPLATRDALALKVH